MKKLQKGDKLQIQCYKHDGNVHRAWDEAVFLDETKDYMIFGNNKTLVIESHGSVWKTKEPAILYFFKDKWYNIIAQAKDEGVSYYCNIATPYIIEDNTIKYIDYDLDLRVFPNGSFKILDRHEYKYHKKKMNYSDALDKILQVSLSELINEYQKNKVYFDSKKNLEYVEEYRKIISEKR